MIVLIKHEYPGALKATAELYLQNMLTLPGEEGYVATTDDDNAGAKIDLAMAIINGMSWTQPPISSDDTATKNLVIYNNKTGKFERHEQLDDGDSDTPDK